MDIDELFDEVIAEAKAEDHLQSYQTKRTSRVTQGRFKRRLRDELEDRVGAIGSGSGNPYLKNVEHNDEGDVEKIRLRVYSSLLSKKYHRTIRISDGVLDLDKVQDKAEELAQQVEEKEAEYRENKFEPELGTIGEFLMEEKGYNRQTAWLHENYEDRAEEASVEEVGKVTRVESYNNSPFRFKVHFGINSDNYENEDELEKIAIEKAEEMFSEARSTSTFVKTGTGHAQVRMTID